MSTLTFCTGDEADNALCGMTFTEDTYGTYKGVRQAFQEKCHIRAAKL